MAVEGFISETMRRGVAVGPLSAVRTLPIRVNPLPEESFDSWLEALAGRMDAAWGEILGSVGVFGMQGHTASYWAARANVSLAPSQVDTISYCSGLKPRRLEAMTLQPWIKSSSWQRRSAASLRVTGSRFCPACLKERGGRWRVWWRLRWAFACPTHGCLLAEACCVCGGLQRTAPPRFDEVPKLGLCTRGVTRSGERIRCGGRLSSAPVIRLASASAVVIQRELLRMLRAGYASGGIYRLSPVPSTVFMRDLYTLGTWMLRYAQPCDVATRISDLLWDQFVHAATERFAGPLITSTGARVTYGSVAADAATACIAVPILQADNTDIAAQDLHWLTMSMRRRGISPTNCRNCWSTGHSRSLDTLRRTVLSSC